MADNVPVDMDIMAAVVASTGFVVMAGAAVELSRRKRKKRSVWVKPWILERPVHGAYSSLVSELINTDAASFRNYTRMDVASFEELLSRVEAQNLLPPWEIKHIPTLMMDRG
jgi:hypothetical protein